MPSNGMVSKFVCWKFFVLLSAFLLHFTAGPSVTFCCAASIDVPVPIETDLFHPCYRDMAKVKTLSGDRSFFRAIDGSHLKWNDFREDVLQPFGIRVAHADELNVVPPALYSRLQDRLLELSRFDHQRQRWQGQVAIGQGFASPTIFPPNILPPLLSPTRVQRLLSPKMSREALPRRSRSVASLFELPSSRPFYVAAFTQDSFSEAEHSVLPSTFSTTGTVLDFSSGAVDSSRTLYCPFLIFERCASIESDEIEKTLNMCAISGSQCVRGLQDIAMRALKRIPAQIFSFSCLLNDTMATINIHTTDEQGRYVMSALYKFDLSNEEQFNTFQAWIEAIEDWASQSLLPDLKDYLTKISKSGDTPPASPMPSLTLSIDTDVGVIPGLMKALRRTYPTVAWQADEVSESPINSSMAHCGTPFDGRKARGSLLGSPDLSANTFSNLMFRRGRTQSMVSALNIRGSGLQYTPAKPSPFSPRYTGCVTTTPGFDPSLESPCRPGTLSPFTPPPEQPWAAKSPMLVLQKRVDIAMNEVQDLRHQVELLQSELSVKNQQLNERFAAMEKWQKHQEKQEAQQLVQRKLQLKLRARDEAKLETVQTVEKSGEGAQVSYMARLRFEYEGWDILLEQLLFAIALIALTVMGLMVFLDLSSVLSQAPTLFQSRLVWALQSLSLLSQ